MPFLTTPLEKLKMPAMSELHSTVNSVLSPKPRFKIGDKVWTTYTGKVTEHEIFKCTTERVSQTGIMYKVIPQLDNDWGSWYDQGWFHPKETYAPATINNS